MRYSEFVNIVKENTEYPVNGKAILDAAEKYYSSQNSGKPIVSGSLPPSGIEEYDELIRQFQNLEIDFLALTCGLWNKGYNAGKEYCSGGNNR